MRLRDFGAVDQRFAGSSGFAGIVGLRQNKLLFSLPGPQYAQELENGAQSLPLWGIGGMCAAGESWQDAARRHGEADTGCSVKLFSSRETYYLNINSDIYAVDVEDVPAPALLYAAAFRPPDNPYGDLQTVYGVEYFAHLQGTPKPGEDVAALLALGQPLLIAAAQQALTLDNLLEAGAELFANPDYPRTRSVLHRHAARHAPLHAAGTRRRSLVADSFLGRSADALGIAPKIPALTFPRRRARPRPRSSAASWLWHLCRAP